MKKAAKTVDPIDGKAARAEKLKIVCTICKVRTDAPNDSCPHALLKQELSDLHVYKIHFEAKHPKLPVPPELSGAE